MKLCSTLLLLSVLAACSTGDSRLYEGSQPPKLRDGTVRMTTHWWPGKEEPKDMRVVRVRSGVVSCTHISQAHGHFEGEASEKSWRRLWTKLFQARPFTERKLKIEPADPRGGPYHVIQLQLGDRTSAFSAQVRQNALIFTTTDVVERVEYANTIVNFVAEHANTKLGDAGGVPESRPKKRSQVP